MKNVIGSNYLETKKRLREKIYSGEIKGIPVDMENTGCYFCMVNCQGGNYVISNKDNEFGYEDFFVHDFCYMLAKLGMPELERGFFWN